MLSHLPTLTSPGLFDTFLPWSIALLIVLYILADIVRRKMVRALFPVFAGAGGFLVFGLIGAVGPALLRTYSSFAFHAVNLATALTFLAVHLIARRLAQRLDIQELVTEQDRRLIAATPVLLRSAAIFSVVIGSSAILLWLASPPLIFSLDLGSGWATIVRERVEQTSGSGALFYRLYPLLIVMPLFLTVLAGRGTGLRLQEEVARSWRRFLLITLPVWVVISVSMIFFIELAFLLGALILCYLYIRDRVPWLKMIAISTALAILGIGVYLFKYGIDLLVRDWQFALAVLHHRVFEAYPMIGALIMTLFPARMEFLEGRSFLMYLQPFGYQTADLPRLLYPHMYTGPVGAAPPPALFEFYANFGWAGIVMGLGIIFVSYLALVWLNWSRHPLLQIIGLFLVVRGLTLWTSGFINNFLNPPQFIMLAVFYLLVLAVARMREQNH